MNVTEARASGAKRYFTGKPCKRGHIADRLTANNHCSQCLTERNALLRALPDYLEKKREWYRRTGKRYRTGRDAEQQRAYYAANKDIIVPRVVERARRRKLLAKAAMPQWADPAAILSFYEIARALTVSTGVPHEVDHVVPFRSNIICGLHVQNNLQVIPASVNRSKKNKVPDLAPIVARIIANFDPSAFMENPKWALSPKASPRSPATPCSPRSRR